MSDYPEHEKLRAVREQAQSIGEFLEWAHAERGWQLASYHEIGELAPVGESRERMFAAYFEIDLVKLEAEKCAMLEKVREIAERLLEREREAKR